MQIVRANIAEIAFMPYNNDRGVPGRVPGQIAILSVVQIHGNPILTLTFPSAVRVL
jgi:hypothetical protein